MESANSHHHLQDQLVGSSASSFATNYGVGFTTTHAWPPTSFLNSNCLSSYPSETKLQENPTAVSSQLYMAPDLGFINWGNNINTQNSDQDLQHQSRIKEELVDHYYRKYSEMLSSSPALSSITDELQQQQQGNDVAAKLLLKSLSSSYGKIPDFFPDSSFNNQTAPVSLDMNLDALNLLASSRFRGNLVASSQNLQIGILRDGFSSYGFDQMHHSHQIPFYGSNKVSSASSNALAEAKRYNNKMEPKAQIQKAPKRSRIEARSSCPPFKVRKEKLGDRIAALQQLVAPFGKTDTASVLMEAIGYIKFLQSQVETLSVPYMKASRNKPNRISKGGAAENENEEAKRDLKSRGLCLVPLSCLSYITDGGSAAVWPPPRFGGAT